MTTMLRREFVRRLPVVTAGVAACTSAASLAACAGARWVVPSARPGGLAVPTAAVDAEAGAFVRAPGMERPIYLRRDVSGAVLAVLASCTHRGCQPEPLGDRLVCPCHGSEFSFAGEVLQGPAERPLVRYEVTEADGEIVVRTGGRGR